MTYKEAIQQGITDYLEDMNDPEWAMEMDQELLVQYIGDALMEAGRVRLQELLADATDHVPPAEIPSKL